MAGGRVQCSGHCQPLIATALDDLAAICSLGEKLHKNRKVSIPEEAQAPPKWSIGSAIATPSFTLLCQKVRPKRCLGPSAVIVSPVVSPQLGPWELVRPPGAFIITRKPHPASRGATASRTVATTKSHHMAFCITRRPNGLVARWWDQVTAVFGSWGGLSKSLFPKHRYSGVNHESTQKGIQGA